MAGLLEESTSESAEVRMLGVVDFRNTPRVDTSSDGLPINFNFFLGTNNGKGKKSLEEYIIYG